MDANLINLTVIVSFGEITQEQKQVAEDFGSQIYSWTDFLLLVKLV